MTVDLESLAAAARLHRLREKPVLPELPAVALPGPDLSLIHI